MRQKIGDEVPRTGKNARAILVGGLSHLTPAF